MRGNESFPNVERSLLKGKRDRDLETVQTLSVRRNLHTYLEKKAALAFQGECAAQTRLSEAEAEMDRRKWKKEMLILHSLKPIENLNLRDCSSIRRLDGPIRLKEKRSVHLETET